MFSYISACQFLSTVACMFCCATDELKSLIAKFKLYFCVFRIQDGQIDLNMKHALVAIIDDDMAMPKGHKNARKQIDFNPSISIATLARRLGQDTQALVITWF